MGREPHRGEFPASTEVRVSMNTRHLVSWPTLYLAISDVDIRPCPRTETQAIAKTDTENSKAHVVRIIFRGQDLYLLPGPTTDHKRLTKEAVHFDDAITFWEKWGTFETLTSMHGRFVVQYDKEDVVGGIPRAMIGTTANIVSVDADREDSRSQLRIPGSSMLGKRKRAVSTIPVEPEAKKTCIPDDEDEIDEPPDWSEYEDASLTGYGRQLQARSDSKPDEILDTRVTFFQIDIIPPGEYKAMYESEGATSPPRNYMIRGQAVPEMAS